MCRIHKGVVQIAERVLVAQQIMIGVRGRGETRCDRGRRRRKQASRRAVRDAKCPLLLSVDGPRELMPRIPIQKKRTSYMSKTENGRRGGKDGTGGENAFDVGWRRYEYSSQVLFWLGGDEGREMGTSPGPGEEDFGGAREKGSKLTGATFLGEGGLWQRQRRYTCARVLVYLPAWERTCVEHAPQVPQIQHTRTAGTSPGHEARCCSATRSQQPQRALQ